MPHHDYLIVGGGMTADAAVRGIRSVDDEGSVGVITLEPDPPYERPPLSKGLWFGRNEDRIWRGTETLGVELHLERKVVRIDREERIVQDDRGTIFSYGDLLLATGGSPRRLDDGAPQVNYFRTYRDFVRLREDVREKERFAVIGGGFIGSEISAVLASKGKEVVVLFPEEGLCRGILPAGLSSHLDDYFRERGVEIRSGRPVNSVRKSGEEFLVTTDEEGRRPVRVQAVVAGLGIEPETTLAENAGLEVEDGIVVNSSFRTSDPHVYAAGDVAAFWCPPLGRRLRVEHEDHANTSGMIAGRCMAGDRRKYDHVPFFYSDLFDLAYEGVGELDPELETVEDWAVPRRKGVVYYLEDDRVRGVLLWNLKGRLRDARELLRDGRVRSPGDLEGRIPLE